MTRARQVRSLVVLLSVRNEEGRQRLLTAQILSRQWDYAQRLMITSSHAVARTLKSLQ
jgi:hypothetical protein